MMKKFLGYIAAISVLLILLITSVEAVCYWIPGYFEREYKKYDVLDHLTAEMTMDDLIDVTKEMMDYLHGDRDNLHVETIKGGEQVEFFNDREIAHMKDVQLLFIKGMHMRVIAVIMALASFGILILRKDAKALEIFFACYRRVFLVFAILAALCAIALSGWFDQCFILFHKVFFDNDLWILDPRTDDLINIVPEGFFMDTALRIGIIFVSSTIVLFVIAMLNRKKQGR